MQNQNDRKEENTMEGEPLDLGEISKETQGGFVGHGDGGGGYIYP